MIYILYIICSPGLQILCLSLLIISPAALILIRTTIIEPHWFYVFDSVSNGVINYFSIAFSILSDIIPPQHRAVSFGLYYASFLTGMTVGSYSAVSSALHPGGNNHHADPMRVCALCLIFRITALLVAVFLLPETLVADFTRVAVTEEDEDEDEAQQQQQRQIIIQQQETFSSLPPPPPSSSAPLQNNR